MKDPKEEEEEWWEASDQTQDREAFRAKYEVFHGWRVNLVTDRLLKGYLAEKLQEFMPVLETPRGLYRRFDQDLRSAVRQHISEWTDVSSRLHAVTRTTLAEAPLRGFTPAQAFLCLLCLKCLLCLGQVTPSIQALVEAVEVPHQLVETEWSEMLGEVVRSTGQPACPSLGPLIEAAVAEAVQSLPTEWSLETPPSPAVETLLRIEGRDLGEVHSLLMQVQLTTRCLDGVQRYGGTAARPEGLSELRLLGIADVHRSNPLFRLFHTPALFDTPHPHVRCTVQHAGGVAVETFLEIPVLFYLFGQPGEPRDRCLALLAAAIIS